VGGISGEETIGIHAMAAMPRPLKLCCDIFEGFALSLLFA